MVFSRLASAVLVFFAPCKLWLLTLVEGQWMPSQLGVFFMWEMPRMFPEWVRFLNISSSVAVPIIAGSTCRSRSCMQMAVARRSGIFRDAMWVAMKRTQAFEGDHDVDGTEDLDSVSSSTCRVMDAKRAALRTLRFRGDVMICWQVDHVNDMCCMLGCIGLNSSTLPGKQDVNRCCARALAAARPLEVCVPRCLAARSLMPVWGSIASWNRYSQSKQDAALTFLLSHLGIRNRFFVEIGFNQPDWEQDSSGSNTKMLYENGWRGLLFDNFFENHSIGLYKHNITMENVAQLLESHGTPMDPDYVSIDIDSCDLWVFLGITRKFRPRIVSIEYNANWALTEHYTVDCIGAKIGSRLEGESFRCLPSMLGEGTFENICGASLAAIASAAKLRGYTLIWVDPHFDAYLVRNDLICAGEEPSLSEFAYATRLTTHSPPADPSRKDRWLIDFRDFVGHASHSL
eukprot:TRINITY_DN9604_c0_g2_i1.p1 TRINITY_DN9604_c0_g2~~TRINITY_DN9604_c0_g2_i1.p1  ORF type:complete len:458 (-),score=33.37 TRINITY_DN9604_c0_g2_i1:291-1664(-)